MSDLQDWLITWVRTGMARKGSWYNQVLLARDAGISTKHLSQLLTGQVVGSLDMWDHLLVVLGVRDEALSDLIVSHRT